MTHEYTQDLSIADYEIKVAPATYYGYWENKATGQGGQMWFALVQGAVEIIAGDAIPPAVVKVLLAADYAVAAPFRAAASLPKVNLERRRHG